MEKAHQCLVKFNGLPKLEIHELEEQLTPALTYGKIVGNCYTASLYLSLISLLENDSHGLTGQRIGFYSYGSGCVAEFFSGVIQPGYQTMLNKDRHLKMLKQREALSQEQYESFYNYTYPVDGSSLVIASYRQGGYRLAAIEDHKRIYKSEGS